MRQRLQRALDDVDGCLPVPLSDVADMAGWTIYRAPGLAPEAWGIAVIAAPVAVAVIDDSLDGPTQRYVLAHEMGHVLAGHDGLVMCSRQVPTAFEAWIGRRVEREADILAARILIPGSALVSEDMEEVARSCNVPTWLVSVRLMDRLGRIGSFFMPSGR